MTLFKTIGQMPCLRRYFLSRWYNIQYKTGKYIYFKLLWIHMQKDFFEITDRTKLDYFKKLRYTCRPHTSKIYARIQASGLKRHPVQDGQ